VRNFRQALASPVELEFTDQLLQGAGRLPLT
jgi:hypothetical protein